MKIVQLPFYLNFDLRSPLKVDSEICRSSLKMGDGTMCGLFMVREKVEELLFLIRNMKKRFVIRDRESLNAIPEIPESLRNIETLVLRSRTWNSMNYSNFLEIVNIVIAINSYFIE